MCKNPGLGPSDYNQKRQRTIYDLKLHETMSIHVGHKFVHHETGCDEVKKFITVMRVEGGWIYGVDTQTPSFVPQVSEPKKETVKESEEKIVDGKLTVGTHRRVFEYDGLYHCLDCDAKWGAGWRVLEKAPLICDPNVVRKDEEPDKTVEAPPLDFVNENTGKRTPPPTTEYVGSKKDDTTIGIMSRAVRRFFGGKD